MIEPLVNMMKAPEGIKKTAVMCVLKNDAEFLLLRRQKEPNKGLYTPVGGKLEPYESLSRAVVRETFEETGIEIFRPRFHGTLVETSPTDYNWSSFIYSAEISTIDPPASNEGALEWIAFTNLLSAPTPTTDWFLYKYLLEGRLFAFSADYDEHLQLLCMREEIEGKVVYSHKNA